MKKNHGCWAKGDDAIIRRQLDRAYKFPYLAFHSGGRRSDAGRR
ncbi:hypothetical protein ALO_07328 [Acetonema longum DSM 6540]|uniref:Uncharacterized protein n=1 Tax=Acetonema longum DSM 6540 TaxID=1009370 RepID=F7NHC0_9FIRM|nr:hypothetical protein ALO_07328 [Acetonema longum DSM 6540]